MRKADYALLAMILNVEIRAASARIATQGIRDDELHEQVSRRETAEHIARSFADKASVNKPVFLKACGLE